MAASRRSTRNSDATKADENKENAMPTKPNTKAKRAATNTTKSPAAKKVKIEEYFEDPMVKTETGLDDTPKNSQTADEDNDSDLSDVPNDDEDGKPRKRKTPESKSNRQSKQSPNTKADPSIKSDPEDKEAKLRARKLKDFQQHSKTSPFPDFPHPTAEEAKLAHRILTKLHGARTRPAEVVASTTSAGCGDSPSVLDALVRTILSQNTSDKNSTRAKLNMDKVYGGSDNWAAIAEGGRDKLMAAIKSGGLSQVKSKVIISILEQAMEKYGEYSLDHLFEKSDDEAMQELLSFQGVGPKTASCVLLFCLKRESFAVDTHVHRITGLLGWRPKTADREKTHQHLDVRVPDEDKYGLHILLVGHGKKCEECKAGGVAKGRCELRNAFRGKGGVKKEEDDEEEVKVESVESDDAGEKVKKEDDEGEEGKGDGKEEWESGQEDFVNGMQSKKGLKHKTEQKDKKGSKAKPKRRD